MQEMDKMQLAEKENNVQEMYKENNVQLAEKEKYEQTRGSEEPRNRETGTPLSTAREEDSFYEGVEEEDKSLLSSAASSPQTFMGLRAPSPVTQEKTRTQCKQVSIDDVQCEFQQPRIKQVCGVVNLWCFVIRFVVI